MKYTIDAKNKKLGRVASEAAGILMGKNSPLFSRNKLPLDASVEIINAAHIDLNRKKLTQKTYAKYSGYPGGLRQEKMETIVAKKGYKELFRLAVYGMLPSNKLRPRMIKKLTITE